MKPPRFKYVRPSSLQEALEVLRHHGPEAKLLAGGQSLIPLMNFRLAHPKVLIDVNNLDGLDSIDESAAEAVTIGTNVRHIDVERWRRDDALGTLLSGSARHIGHLPIRYRGTFGGSLAHADPAAEWCMLSLLLDAEVIAQSVDRTRTIPAAELFVGVFTTSLEPDEMITGIRIGALPQGTRTGFLEFARRAGDFALVSVAFTAEMDGSRVRRGRITMGGVSEVPVAAMAAAQQLEGSEPDEELVRRVAETAAEEVEPLGDIHGSAEYRRDLIKALMGRMMAKEFGVELVGR